MKRSNYFIGAGLSLVAVLLILMTVHKFGILAEGNLAVTQIKAELIQAESLYAELEQLALYPEALQTRLEELNTAMPPLYSADMLLSNLQNLALAIDGELLQVWFEQPVEQDGFVMVSVHMEINTDYESLLELADHLQFGSRAVRIDSFNIQEMHTTTGKLLVSLKAIYFYTKPDYKQENNLLESIHGAARDPFVALQEGVADQGANLEIIESSNLIEFDVQDQVYGVDFLQQKIRVPLLKATGENAFWLLRTKVTLLSELSGINIESFHIAENLAGNESDPECVLWLEEIPSNIKLVQELLNETEN